MTSNWNLLGLWTLYTREVRRFLKVYNQTIISPVITALLFLAIFHLTVGDHMIKGIPFIQFIASGIIAMIVVQNAFSNSSSSMVSARVIGFFANDYLIPPISPREFVLAFVAGSITRGIIVGAVAFVAINCFVDLSIKHFIVFTIYLFLSSMMLALFGILCGIVSSSFDQMSAMTNYVITPLSFLSGTFYSIHSLPIFWQKIAYFNPFFYMIDGIRYGLIGISDVSTDIGVIVLLLSNIILYCIVYRMIKTGYRIKN